MAEDRINSQYQKAMNIPDDETNEQKNQGNSDEDEWKIPLFHKGMLMTKKKYLIQ